MNEDNAEYGGNMDTLKTRVKVYHNGDMFWIAPLIIQGHCEIHVNDFPFDTQRCSLKFASWTTEITRLNLSIGGFDLQTDIFFLFLLCLYQSLICIDVHVSIKKDVPYKHFVLKGDIPSAEILRMYSDFGVFELRQFYGKR